MSKLCAILGMGLIFAACSDDSTTPPTSDGGGDATVINECQQSQTKCDDSATKLLTCEKNSAGNWIWGTPQVCAGGKCESGKCVNTCGGPCNTPPNDCHKDQGTCWNGKCIYDPKDNDSTCDDQDTCTSDDKCSSGICKGTVMTCDQPPQNACKDANTLTVYAAQGSCSTGQCSYPSSDVPCALGCDSAAGKCKGDPCSGVTCNTPPNGCYKAAGLCSGGKCTYLYDDAAQCDDQDACTDKDKCIGGQCKGDPKVCNTPPAGTCKDASTAITHDTVGSCALGKCEYKQNEVACAHGCDSAAGKCKTDPCANITCNTPLNGCYKAVGKCVEGKCEYEEDNGIKCDDKDACTEKDTCISGQCKGSTISCNTPPASTCKDSNTATVFAAPGNCNGGKCTYGSADVACPFGCDSASGFCKGDPCANVKCDTPPNTECYTVPGICSAGKCTYLTKSGEFCDDKNACTKGDVCDSKGTCAGTTYTCSDSLVCTKDVCDGKGGCTFPLAANSCLLNIEGTDTCFQADNQNPGNGCQFCNPAKSTSMWTVAQGTKQIGWNFDDGTLQSFTTTPAVGGVGWQVVNKRSVSPSFSLYFGNPATWTYDNGSQVSGTATSPKVTLPKGQGKLCVRFQLFKGTEDPSDSYDLLSLKVTPTTGTAKDVWLSQKEVNYGAAGTAFIQIAADISSFAGSEVSLGFLFDSVDSIYNDHEGVYLDDIEIITNCTIYAKPAVVINEIMPNPKAVNDEAGEWLELHNTTAKDIDVQGWVIKDNDSDKHTINHSAGKLVIPAGGFVVLARSSNISQNGGVKVDYQYLSTEFYLANSADEVVLVDSTGTTVDAFAYTASWKIPDGASLSRLSTTADPNLFSTWCAETKAWVGSAGDFGTPGAALGCGAK